MMICCACERPTEAEEIQVLSVEEAEAENLGTQEYVPVTAEPVEFEEDLEPAGCAFECTVSKKRSSNWGWVLDQWEEACQVASVSVGGISDYNASAPKGQSILQFDLITRVNNEWTSRGMADEVKASETLKLKVFRPAQVNVRVSREGLSWGVELKYQQNSSVCLRVTQIEKGAVSNENSKRHWPALRVNDFIIRINGEEGKPKVLTEQWKSADTADLVVLRSATSA